MNLTDFERRRLKKLQDTANKYHEAREAHGVEGVRLARIANKLYGDFDKFWSPIRDRESKHRARGSVGT